jgi:hypothetical protein
MIRSIGGGYCIKAGDVARRDDDSDGRSAGSPIVPGSARDSPWGDVLHDSNCNILADYDSRRKIIYRRMTFFLLVNACMQADVRQTAVDEFSVAPHSRQGTPSRQ